MTKLDEGLKGNVFREKWRIHMVGGAMWDVIHLASIFFLWNQHCWEIFHELNSSIKLEEVVISSCTIQILARIASFTKDVDSLQVRDKVDMLTLLDYVHIGLLPDHFALGCNNPES